MRFKLEFDCDNAAFGESPIERLDEVARILRSLGDHVGGMPTGQVRDVNGNGIGFWVLAS
jgi:hypothetical protein